VTNRPPDRSPEEWRQQRARVWARRNAFLNLLIVAVCVAVIWRYCGS
jgi:hypothetical protein